MESQTRYGKPSADRYRRVLLSLWLLLYHSLFLFFQTKTSAYNNTPSPLSFGPPQIFVL